MTAYKESNDKSIYNLYITISMALVKNKCELVNIDLETGILDICGKNEEVVRQCHHDVQKIFANYLFR